jgi:hypothetical protein
MGRTNYFLLTVILVFVNLNERCEGVYSPLEFSRSSDLLLNKAMELRDTMPKLWHSMATMQT